MTFELTVAIAGDGDLAFTVVAYDSLFAVTVAAVARIISEDRILLVTEMLIHLCLQHLLDGAGKETLKFRLYVCGSIALRHQHPRKLHFLLGQFVSAFSHGFFLLVFFWSYFCHLHGSVFRLKRQKDTVPIYYVISPTIVNQLIYIYGI